MMAANFSNTSFSSFPYEYPPVLGTSNFSPANSPVCDIEPMDSKVLSSKTSFGSDVEEPTLIRMSSKKNCTDTYAKKGKVGTKKKHRGVRFSLDTNDDVVSEVVIYQKVATIYNSELYLSRKEQAMIQFLAKSQGETFLMENEDTVEDLDRAFLSCNRDDIAPSADMKNVEAICRWAASNVRGLEEVVSCEFHEERTLTSAMILDYHAYLRETLGSNQRCDELLRTFCERLSCRSRLFATKMGMADTLEAARRG